MKHFKDIKQLSLTQALASQDTNVIQDVAMYAHYGLKIRADKLREMQLRKKVNQSIMRLGKT